MLYHQLRVDLERRYDTNAARAAIGAVFILRCVVPGLVTPQLRGFMSEDVQLNDYYMRTMLLLGKVIQNVSNNVLYGDKEPDFVPLNDFITRNVEKMNVFLEAICTVPENPVYTPIEQSAKEKKDQMLNVMGIMGTMLHLLKSP